MKIRLSMVMLALWLAGGCDPSCNPAGDDGGPGVGDTDPGDDGDPGDVSDPGDTTPVGDTAGDGGAGDPEPGDSTSHPWDRRIRVNILANISTRLLMTSLSMEAMMSSPAARPATPMSLAAPGSNLRPSSRWARRSRKKSPGWSFTFLHPEIIGCMDPRISGVVAIKPAPSGPSSHL